MQASCTREGLVVANDSQLCQNRALVKTAGTRQTRAIRLGSMCSILALAGVLSADVEQQIAWFQSKGLLAHSKICPACNSSMTLQTRTDITDQYR